MIEVYLLVTLAAIGYMMNSAGRERTRKYVVMNSKQRQPPCNIPTNANIYNSNYFTAAQNEVACRASKMYNQAKHPKRSNVISKNYAFEKDDPEYAPPKTTKPIERVRLLSGEYVTKEDFTFNNMTPFFGGRVRQNMDDEANKNILETYTGVSSADFKRKCEVGSFYDNKKDVTNMNGMQNKDDFYRDRMVAPRTRNNVTPIEKEYVGPGLNQGYSSTPTGGYQQFELQDLMMPKCVDELRVKTNPKTTYEGRIVDGMKGRTRAEVKHLDKNRASTVYEQTPDHLLRTTGAYTKEAGKPEFNVKQTHRISTTREYMGTAMATNVKAPLDPDVRASVKPQFGDYGGVRNAYLGGTGKGEKDDYGKSQIMVYENERDITSTRVYQGNLTSLVKAIVSPITDLFKDTKKDELIDNPRHFGNMQAQFPAKATVYDPNDVMRATVKETTIHEAALGNLKGHEKITVHDPNDIARTTTKETTIHEAALGNLKGHEKITVHDPNDIARTTIKETTIHEAALGNLKGHKKNIVHDPNDIARTTTKETTIHEASIGNLKGYEKITVHDPNDIARTTIKETLIHDDMGTGTITGAKQLFVYDPDEIAKTTGRETLEHTEYVMNMANAAKKGKVYDPLDVARKTMKETTEMNEHTGHIDRYEGMGDYNTTEYVAPLTQKQFLSDNDYIGIAAHGQTDGYKVANVIAPNTQKQFLSDVEYYGVAEAGTNKAQKSYDDMYNAHISSTKESTLHERDPTKTGKKTYASKDDISMCSKKPQCDQVTTRYTPNFDKVTAATPELSDTTFTREKPNYGQDDRLDPSLLSAFLENPFTQPLNSVA